MKIELGPVRIARIVGEKVRRNPNGSVDILVRWEDETEGNNAKGTVHIHEREVGMIVRAFNQTLDDGIMRLRGAQGKRDLNGGYRG
jgi:hypothetical protein